MTVEDPQNFDTGYPNFNPNAPVGEQLFIDFTNKCPASCRLKCKDPDALPSEAGPLFLCAIGPSLATGDHELLREVTNEGETDPSDFVPNDCPGGIIIHSNKRQRGNYHIAIQDFQTEIDISNP